MKLRLEFHNPLKPEEKIKKTFTFRGKRKEQLTKQLLEMSDKGMVIIPVDVHFSLDGIDYSRTIMLSTPTDTASYRGNINQRPKTEVPEVTVSDDPELFINVGKGKNVSYRYTALDCKGREIDGLISADDQAEAIRTLKDKNLFPTKITEVGVKVVLREEPRTSTRITIKRSKPKFDDLKKKRPGIISRLFDKLNPPTRLGPGR